MIQNKCSHCLDDLVCMADDIENCACQGVDLLNETVDFLHNKTNHECLCPKCLKQFDAWMKYSLAYEFPKRMSMMRPEHYYIENGFTVFTGLYHFQKGACCGNNCRHCVYTSKVK